MRVALLTVVSCVLACGGVHTSLREAPRAPTTSVVAGASSPLVVTTSFDKGALAGDVRFANTCASKTTTPIERTEVTRDTTIRNTGIVTTSIGAALLGGGIYGLLGWVPRASSDETCDKGADGQETCSSPRGTAQAVSITGVVLGGLAVGAGAIMLGAGTPTTEKKLPDAKREVLGARDVACGKTEQLDGVELALSVDGVARVGRVDREGHFRIDLNGAKKGEVAPLVVHSVPPALIDRVASGTNVGAVDLAAFLASLDVEANAALVAQRKQADEYPFTGVVHGDQAARDRFTTACTPAGKDVCGNALDDDCDGEVDWGCGWSSGALQWTLAWDSDDDLDLVVVGPDGVEVSSSNRKGGDSQLALDVDCAGVGCARRIENIFSPRTQKPRPGTYRAFVVVKSALATPDASRSIKVTLGGRVGGRSYRLPLTLQGQSGVRTSMAFAVGDDGDKDSVIDAEDRCPTQPGPWSEFAEDRGCPDADQDGVSDARDACPKDAGIRTDDVKTHGCPKVFGSARLTARGVEFTGTIQFATGKADVLPASFKILEDIARVMKLEPAALELVAIEGHTDAVGERAANMKLSHDRVQSVLEHLVKKQGIAAERWTTHWFGPDRPIADNTTDAGRAKNRRVELRVVRPAPKVVTSW